MFVACETLKVLQFQFDLQKPCLAWKNISLELFSLSNAFLSKTLSRTFLPTCDDEIENANRFTMILVILNREMNNKFKMAHFSMKTIIKLIQLFARRRWASFVLIYMSIQGRRETFTVRVLKNSSNAVVKLVWIQLMFIRQSARERNK